jgi:ribosomal protein S18 acetylase RimI-like enzyme
MPLEIRPAIASDLPQLMGLDHSSSTDHVWQLELRRDPREQQVAATFREVRLPRPVALVYPNNPFALADEWTHKAIVVMAVSGKDPVGYLAIAEPRSSVGWITDIVVAPRWRRQGVASLMLNGAQQWSVDRGHHRIFLEMQSKNYPCVKLAQKHGYEFCGYNDHYYSTQDLAIFFVRVL